MAHEQPTLTASRVRNSPRLLTEASSSWFRDGFCGSHSDCDPPTTTSLACGAADGRRFAAAGDNAQDELGGETETDEGQGHPRPASAAHESGPACSGICCVGWGRECGWEWRLALLEDDPREGLRTPSSASAGPTAGREDEANSARAHDPRTFAFSLAHAKPYRDSAPTCEETRTVRASKLRERRLSGRQTKSKSFCPYGRLRPRAWIPRENSVGLWAVMGFSRSYGRTVEPDGSIRKLSVLPYTGCTAAAVAVVCKAGPIRKEMSMVCGPRFYTLLHQSPLACTQDTRGHQAPFPPSPKYPPRSFASADDVFSPWTRPEIWHQSHVTRRSTFL
uniref:Uncharacterized protein n=1 Tax=Mycena chlorophos TaxID=658473 RepID=A0ABQ0L2G0_MYCCL|nr:predicted protein [Mycena chlorophos]